MEELMINVNWVAVFVGAATAFGLGMLWYSPAMFGTKWQEGIGIAKNDTTSMLPAMITQAVGTLLLAWIVGLTATTNSLGFALLITLTIAILMKANGLFAKKSCYAIAVDSGYVIAMVLVMVIVHCIL